VLECHRVKSRRGMGTLQLRQVKKRDVGDRSTGNPGQAKLRDKIV
jgi:hypothetical protein